MHTEDRDARAHLAEAVTTPPGPEERAALGAALVEAAYLEGDFVLSSGERSNYYFDKYLFETKPGILRRIAVHMTPLLPPGVERIAGPELGAVALATALSLETGLPFLIVRKDVKGHGTDRVVEGEFTPGEHVVVVEDVVSTGGEAIRAASRLRELGAKVDAIIAVVDREQGGMHNVEAAGFRLVPLFRRSELGV